MMLPLYSGHENRSLIKIKGISISILHSIRFKIWERYAISFKTIDLSSGNGPSNCMYSLDCKMHERR